MKCLSPFLNVRRVGRRYGSDAVNYAFGLAHGHSSCEKDAITQLVEILKEVALLLASSACGHARLIPSAVHPHLSSVWHVPAAYEHVRRQRISSPASRLNN